VWDTGAVEAVTMLLLLRIRHRLHSRGRLGPVFSMAEEAAAIAFAGITRIAAGDAAFALLDASGGSVIDRVRDARLQDAIAQLPALQPALDSYAAERAATLGEDHTRVRQALGSRAAVEVEAVTPVDVIGLYVLLPRL
jgi:hypothetical protein